MQHKPNVLIVCARNKKRSRTAEHIFKNDDRFNVRSGGLSSQAVRKVSEKDLLWANAVLVMEPEHRTKIRDQYNHLDLPEILVLDIPDVYEFMDDELVELLSLKINQALQHF